MHRADERAKKLLALESRALADSFRLLRATIEAEELVAKLEAERVEWVGEEEDDDDTMDWREVAEDDLDDSECFKDPRPARVGRLPAGPAGGAERYTIR